MSQKAPDTSVAEEFYRLFNSVMKEKPDRTLLDTGESGRGRRHLMAMFNIPYLHPEDTGYYFVHYAEDYPNTETAYLDFFLQRVTSYAKMTLVGQPYKGPGERPAGGNTFIPTDFWQYLLECSTKSADGPFKKDSRAVLELRDFGALSAIEAVEKDPNDDHKLAHSIGEMFATLDNVWGWC